MQTARYEKLRKQALDRVFDRKKIISIWRSIVKTQLRSQDIKDLYDNYDLNYNIEDRAQAIRANILSGEYRASRPLIFRIEKKFGVCRHMVVPQPIDALVLQVLIDSVIDQIISNQPSKNAFYSQARHNVPKPHEIAEYGIGMRELWIRLQKKIYKFSSEKELIVTTDLSNYYDSIDMRELKKVFGRYITGDEVLLDMLFEVIEEVSWRPDYLPYSDRGLPTSNLETFRLLAHSFLFEVDEVLRNSTVNCFARWMDDIVIGVNSRKQATEMISSVSDMLKSRGLALNLAKTNIYDKKTAFYNFQFNENAYLSGVKIISKGASGYTALTTALKRRFRIHLRDTAPKYWDKVTKRYVTIFGQLRSEKLLTYVPQLYIQYPSLRNNLLNYLLVLGYKKNTATKVLEILRDIDPFDDISLYQICSLATQWSVPDSVEGKAFLKSVELFLKNASIQRKNPSDFYTLLWFKAKYSEPDELLLFLDRFKYIWQGNTFLRRQATALFSRTLSGSGRKSRTFLRRQIASGEANSAALATQIIVFSNVTSLDKKLDFYLFPQHRPRVYPLPKFLVLCSVLNSDDVRRNPLVRKKIAAYISDPFYKKWLDYTYGIAY